MSNEITELSLATNRISDLMELKAHYGKLVWLVRHCWIWKNGTYRPTIHSEIISWTVGPFMKHNSGGGMKQFEPRSRLLFNDKIADWRDGIRKNVYNVHYEDVHLSPEARYFKVNEYNCGMPTNNIVNWSAIFSTYESAKHWQVMLRVIADETISPWYVPQISTIATFWFKL